MKVIAELYWEKVHWWQQIPCHNTKAVERTTFSFTFGQMLLHSGKLYAQDYEFLRCSKRFVFVLIQMLFGYFQDLCSWYLLGMDGWANAGKVAHFQVKSVCGKGEKDGVERRQEKNKSR